MARTVKKKTRIYCAGAAVVVGAAFLAFPPSRTPQAKAITIAKREAEKRGFGGIVLVDGVEFKRELWIVHLNRFPFTLGGHAVVEVSPNGEVVRYLPGK